MLPLVIQAGYEGRSLQKLNHSLQVKQVFRYAGYVFFLQCRHIKKHPIITKEINLLLKCFK